MTSLPPPQLPGDLVNADELAHAPWRAVARVLWRAVRELWRSRPARVVALGFAVLLLWGYHGELELLGLLSPAWQGPGSDPAARGVLWPGIPWDQELVSFWVGALLLVGVPVLVIRFGWRERLAAWGLGLPPPGRRLFAAAAAVALVAVLLVPFYFGAKQPSMHAVYPFFKGLHGPLDFALYELTYFPFFLAIEFIFRGYLLFGLAPHTDPAPAAGAPAPFPIVALLVQMLPYTAWHLGKPLAELWGTPIWGIAAGALALGSRSIWPVVLAHWLLNVWLDAASLGFF
jgi:hypothetical protein